MLVCECSYKTDNRGNFYKHQKACKSRLRIVLENELAVKEQELAKKDDEIHWLKERVEELTKMSGGTSNTVISNTNNTTNNNNTNNNTTNHINLMLFGDRSHSISDEVLFELLKVPEESVSKLLALRLNDVAGRNVRIPNVRDLKRAEIFTEENGKKKWKRVKTDDIMYDMWDDNRGILEPAAEECPPAVGQRWHAWANRVDNDHVTKGPKWRDLEERMKNTVIDASRGQN